MKKLYILLFALCFSPVVNSQTSSFNITFNGGTPEAQASFQYAAGVWSNLVVSAVPIKVLVHFQPLLPGMLGITFPNGRKNFSGAPLADTWYSTSLANSIAGVELNPGEVDIELYLNSTTAWYFDSTGTVPSGQYDLATVSIHELCHGLGFLSLAKKEGTSGSFGMLLASDFSPLTTSYPWPDLDTLPSIFDRFLVTTTNQQLDTFPNPSATLGSKFTSNTIYFIGANAMAANGGIKPRISATGTFSLGSSITHLNESTYPVGNQNELMTPNGAPAHALHYPGPICLAILKDIGWNMNPNSINEIAGNEKMFNVYPNPSDDRIYFSSSFPKEKIKSIEIKNVLGEKIAVLENKLSADVSMLSKGVYFVVVTTNDFQAVQKFIKE
ncbi:MAG: T9SS type A sorting domain-containing protein [Bacteroidota bacterium]